MQGKQTRIWYGGDYSPDQWDKETLVRDMQLFQKAGVNLVTLPVFSWAKLEPEEGVYCFEWLDEILDVVHQHGISVSLATSTVSQPAWMSKKYPEVLPVDIAGRRRTHGMRMFFCVNSEKYRERAAALAEEMAKRYQNYPGLAAWHVANEYGTYCYCPTCEAKFQKWLEERYISIENLNKCWYTSFWGRTVYQFDEIRLPTELNDDYRFNPAVQQDYLRFITDSTAECFRNEAEVLRRYTPDIPVFSNMSGFIKKIDQFRLNEEMDVVGWDNYPTPGDEMSFPAMKHDIMRGLKNGASYWVAEQSPNQQNWQPYNKLKKPGEVRRIAYQGIGRGADASLFFQLRQSWGGQEKFHGALISHAGSCETRIYKECADLGKELEQLSPAFVGGKVTAEVGMLFEWDNWWALELCSGPSADMDYLAQMHHYYKPFYHQNIPVDILKPDADFGKYKMIVAPLLCMVKPGVAEKLTQFVKEGGTLIATYMTGLMDENSQCSFGAYPGKLREVLGLWVEETDALLPEEENRILANMETLALQGNYFGTFLCDIIHPETAEVLATYGDDFYAGTPCITHNRYGEGNAYYIATQPDSHFMDEFIGMTTAGADINPVLPTSRNVEAVQRITEKQETIVLLNYSSETGWAELNGTTYKNLLEEKEETGRILIPAGEVKVLSKEK